MIRFVLLVCSLLAGCSSDPAPATNGLTPVRVQLNWVPEPEFGGLYAAKLQGFFKAEGLDVTLIKGSAGVPSAQLAASGKVEFGVVSADQIVTLRTRGAPLKAVFASFQTAPRAIVVHADSPHQSLEALWRSDAQVAVEPGQPFAKWLDRKYNGAALKKVASSGGLAGFISNPALAQAVYIFAEPVELERRGIKTRTFKVADSGFNPYAVVLATRDAYLTDNRATVDAFVRALRKGWAHYLDNPGPTNVEMAKLNSAMTKEAMDIAARLATPYVRGSGPLGQMSAARWQALRDQLVQLDPSLAKAPAAAAYFEDVK
jgi:NitT/TauT family transport system substrate-binding protein